MTTRHPGRQGFTLVELLIVIAIIAILASLGTWAAWQAFGRSQEAAIAFELNQLNTLVESYTTRDPKRDYPPDFTDNAYTRQYIRTYFRRYNGGDPITVYPYMDATQPTYVRLDPAEALIFWTVFVSNNAQNPFPTSAPPPPTPPETYDTAAQKLVANNSTNAQFEFKVNQIVDSDRDGWPEYVAPYGDLQAPYVYFRSPYYNAATMTIPTFTPSNNYGKGVAAPYYSSQLSAPMMPPVFVQPKKFQIVSAGLDGDYGEYATPPPMTQKYYPDGLGYSLADEDNITSFSEGGALGSKRP
jgi:prepilin-type N-terminal cleavage/methylation domain-containing protein